MEYGAFLFHKLQRKQLQKLQKIQYRAIRGVLGYWSSTATNIMLGEAKEIPFFSRFKQLGMNYVSRCYTSSNHPMVLLLEELSILVNNPGRGENEPLISEYYEYKKVNSSWSSNPIKELSPCLPLHIRKPG
jgi:hypothetical protein